MVLYSLFVMRPFRSAVAAQIGTSDLTFFFASRCSGHVDSERYLLLARLKDKRVKNCALYLRVLCY